jgi:hypothetical protein
MRYHLHQATRDGLWTSACVLEGDLPQIRSVVIVGWLMGEARWAADETGTLIFGLDAQGKEMKR